MGSRRVDYTEASMKHLEEVADLAYQRWEAEGRPLGRNLDFWSWAEDQVLERRAQSEAKPGGSRPTPEQSTV
jgi:hypothetical protein